MSRIARAPIAIPSGVEIKITPQDISVKGPKGALGFALIPEIELVQEDGMLSVRLVGDRDSASKHTRSMLGTTRAVINNLIGGVSKGFEKHLTIIGVGYRAQAQGDKLSLSLGFSHPVEYHLPAGVSAETPTQTSIVLRSANKQQLGQVAAEIRAYRPPEPYKGKGIRYADEYVMRKQAKKK